MTRVAYLDCFSGISGDMLLGAIIDAGVEVEALSGELQKLGVPGWSLRAERARPGGLAATEARVHGTTPEEIEFHEVGSLDAIVDVVGAICGMRMLGVEQLYCSPLPAGGRGGGPGHRAGAGAAGVGRDVWCGRAAGRQFGRSADGAGDADRRGDRRHVGAVRASGDAR